MFSIFLRRVFWAVLVLLLVDSSTRETRADNGDYLGYSVGSTVKIFINWQSFLDQGISNSWQGPFTDCVVNAYTRWSMVGGARLNPRFWGYTTRLRPRSDEIIISMNEKHSPRDDRLASRFGRPAQIVFHRKSAVTNTPWPFTPYRAREGEIDMQAVLLHELGHAWGLEHETRTDAVMFGGYQWTDRYGPYTDDVKDLRDLYGARADLRFRSKRSTDGGLSWSDFSTNLTRLGLTTTMEPTVCRDSTRQILFYTSENKNPGWIIGNSSGSSFDTRSWWVFGGARSFYGNSGHGYDGEYMMAWVDDRDDHRIKLAMSNDGGRGWFWRAVPGDVQSYATPAVHKLASNTWLLAYAKLDRRSADETGKIVVRVSTNDGDSWGPEVVLSSYYRAEGGVSLASSATGEIRIGFSWSNRTTGANYKKRTLLARLSGSRLLYDGVIYENEGTRTLPVMAATSRNFIQAWREMNFATSINTRNSAPGVRSWDRYRRVVDSSDVTPALAARRGSSWAFLYSLDG